MTAAATTGSNGAMAFVFPGQGTVRVGMGAHLRRIPAAAAVFDTAEEITGTPVGQLCSRGPLDRLIATDNAQLAVTTCNAAALAVLEAEGYQPEVVAGHSVGELSALYAAGALSLADTIRLVATRSRLMADLEVHGKMSAVMGLGVARVEELAAAAATDTEPLDVGLDNAPGHVVVSGAARAIERLAELASDARKIVPLKVGNAFHSSLMAGAVDGWRDAVLAAPLRTPRIPVIPNVSAEPTTDVDAIATGLIEQLTSRVRWTDTMAALSGVDVVVEVGDSKALTGLLRGSGPRCLSMTDPATMRRLRRETVA